MSSRFDTFCESKLGAFRESQLRERGCPVLECCDQCYSCVESRQTDSAGAFSITSIGGSFNMTAACGSDDDCEDVFEDELFGAIVGSGGTFGVWRPHGGLRDCRANTAELFDRFATCESGHGDNCRHDLLLVTNAQVTPVLFYDCDTKETRFKFEMLIGIHAKCDIGGCANTPCAGGEEGSCFWAARTYLRTGEFPSRDTNPDGWHYPGDYDTGQSAVLALFAWCSAAWSLKVLRNAGGTVHDVGFILSIGL